MLDILTKEGLHALSTRNLAGRVGVMEGALFRHFKTKRDIFLSIMQDVENDLMKSLKSIATSQQSAEDRLFQFMCSHVRYLIKNKGITILLFSEAAHLYDAELKSRLHSILMVQKQLIGKIIQDGHVDGVWDSQLRGENVSTLYMGIPITLNVEMVLNTNCINTDNFCENMMCLLKRTREIKKKNFNLFCK